jgi:hypothetical protein
MGMARKKAALRRKAAIPRWLILWTAVLLAPLCLLNLCVAFFGNSIIFPLSPFFLRNKVAALGRYALHRPICLFTGHPPLDDLICPHRVQAPPAAWLLAAIVQVESGGREHRISSAGAMGPGQLTPSTAKLLGVSDPFDSATALDGSGRYLAAQLANFHEVRLAVAAYNAGPGAIVNRTIPQNGETEFYVRKVMHAYASTHRQPPPALASRQAP